jgi:hypothetical protein
VTFRPEFEPPWIGRPYVTALTINRLSQHDTEAMIDRVVGNKPIPTGVRKDIVERTDGIPLFVEEMTKAVLEAGTGEEAQRTAATVPSTALAVPASLHASLMARLNRLSRYWPDGRLSGGLAWTNSEHSHWSAVARSRREAQRNAWGDRMTTDDKNSSSAITCRRSIRPFDRRLQDKWLVAVGHARQAKLAGQFF